MQDRSLFFNEAQPSGLNFVVRDSSTYQRINVEVPDRFSPDITHLYAATVNIYSGDVFRDDQRRVLFVKNILIAPARLLFTPVEMALQLVASVGSMRRLGCGYSEPLAQRVQALAFNILGIVYSPLRALVLSVAHAAAAALGLLSWNSLYFTRDLIARLDEASRFYKSGSKIECFQPVLRLGREPGGRLESLCRELGKQIGHAKRSGELGCCGRALQPNLRYVSVVAQ